MTDLKMSNTDAAKPWVALPGLSLLRVSGADAAEFLDRQLTIMVSSLAAGKTAIGCWCDAKGRSLCTLWIQRDETDDNSFLLACHSALVQQISRRLQLFIVRAAVTLQPVSDVCLAVSTDQANWNVSCWRELRSMQRMACSEDAQLALQWQAHEIRAGFVWLDADTSAQYLPLMLAMSRWQALDFGKGCFPGQEVIARAHYLGRVKRALYRFASSTSSPLPQTSKSVLDAQGASIGEVIAQVTLPQADADQYRCYGLAVLQMGDRLAETVLCYAGNDVKFTLVKELE